MNLQIARKLPELPPGSKKVILSDPNNYRPISILPALSKIVEKVLSTQTRNYLESEDMITKFQFGFRKGKSTSDVLS